MVKPAGRTHNVLVLEKHVSAVETTEQLEVSPHAARRIWAPRRHGDLEKVRQLAKGSETMLGTHNTSTADNNIKLERVELRE